MNDSGKQPPLADRNESEALSDENLLKLVRSGDSEAFDQLFEGYYNDLSLAARRFTSHAEIIQDSIIDVFIALRDNEIKFDPNRGQLFPYLLVAVRNRMVDRFRQEARHVTFGHGMDLDRLASLPTSEEAILSTDVKEALVKALGRLPSLQRRAMLLRHLYGYRSSEVGEILGISSQRVSELLYAARIRLRKALEGA
ncbi:MAG: sigma-70 family RNA polymerase sigma factor [Chloroflexi bacterium]|nr:sigma-70 family RNA polymerase sigma factor [Chloroflexota bacterium]